MGKRDPLELRERVVAFVDEGNSHREAARHFRVSPRFVNDMIKLRPALTNLGRRKPRGLVATYGERALAVGADIAAGARLTVLDAPAAVIFRHLGRGHFAD